MLKISVKADPLTALLLDLVEAWDELERWAVRNKCMEAAKAAADAKGKLLSMIE